RHQGADEAVILIVLGENQRRQIRQPVDRIKETVHVELHFEKALPVLECEHGAPQIPEVGLEKAGAEILLDGEVVEILLALQHQADQFPLL
ncbi:hypothetical protein QU38_01300, partial [Staphylococcus aureus]